MNPTGISIKSAAEIEILRKAGKILAGIVDELKCSLKSESTTSDIERLADKLVDQCDVKAAFKGYRGYPSSVCVSVNEEIVHGIPSDNHVIHDGDIVSVDMGIIYKGYYADMAFSAGIGQIDSLKTDLLTITEQSLYKGIEQARAGNRLTDISHAVQSWVEQYGFSVVREFVGHGIGRFLHEDPEIPNFGLPGEGPLLKTGMVFCIEPMVNAGSWRTKILDDGWTVVTKDGKPSAHFEHMIAILENGPEVLTRISS